MNATLSMISIRFLALRDEVLPMGKPGGSEVVRPGATSPTAMRSVGATILDSAVGLNTPSMKPPKPRLSGSSSFAVPEALLAY